MKTDFKTLFLFLVLGGLLGAGAVSAGDQHGGEPADSAHAKTAASELPEAVAELVEAMSGVQSVEPAEDDTFAVHRKIEVTGSRILRDVTIRVDEDGKVIDWGEDPMFTRSYTRDELIRTGHIQEGEALSKLDPAVQSGGRY